MRLTWYSPALFAVGTFVQCAKSAPQSSSGTLADRAPSGAKSVIIQMFEWTWDSVAAECTSFIGPAGYGFVQGWVLIFVHTHLLRVQHTSEPACRAHTRESVVDRLPTGLLHSQLQERQPQPVRQHGVNLPLRWCQSHRG